MKNKPLLILQARTGSTRLPNKMIRDFDEGKTIPEIIISNLKKQYEPSQIVIATSVKKGDDELEETAHNSKVKCFRGSENDVLKRFIDCAESNHATLIVRICADNPFLQEEYIEPLSYQWEDGTPVMLSHIGVFAEVMTLDFLKRIESLTDEPIYREHVTNFIYTNRNLFQCEFLQLPDFLNGRENIRLTVDTESDFILTQELYQKVISQSESYKLEDLLELIDENPVILSKMEAQIKENAK
jgi:spore coat polysaccharide biosynthesis protein SpsF